MSGSGGERKAKRRAQGWEEAGGEFYQESYPGADLDLDALQQNPSHLATLLPSKQNRTATCKNRDMKTTMRRRTSTRNRYHSTNRRPSAAPGAVVDTSSSLPDLSENLSNEERTWEEIMQIKAMPVNMTQKKELKAKLKNQTKLRLQGLEQLKWRRRKLWQQICRSWSEAYIKMSLWRHSFKKIEGNFGTGVVAYFLFIKWLMFLNLIICILMITFIVLPTIFLQRELTVSSECSWTSNNSSSPGFVKCCPAIYDNTSAETVASFATTSKDNFAMQIFQGTGIMEHTMLFYGSYPDSMLLLYQSPELFYNLPLAYICITIVVMLVSLGAIVKSSAREFKERLVEGEGQFYQYCNIIFGGWDYCIQNEKSAYIKHKAIYNEIKACLEDEKLEEERSGRSRDEMFKLILIRILVNAVVITLLGASGALIYYIFNYSASTLQANTTSGDPLLTMLLEFLPSMTIVGLNLVVPTILSALVRLEKYSPLFVVRLTLLRTVFLRLSSLGVLLASFYHLFRCDPCVSKTQGEKCEAPICWETYVGQQFYKLMLVDFASHIAVTFFINLPRGLLGRHSRCQLAKFLGEQEFDLPKHVLDVVYSQTLCWLGTFYAPILPAIAFVTCFLMFYVKKFACLINSKPSTITYRASRSNSLFMSVLLLSFVVVIIPLGYTIAEWSPSRSCGPFRGQSSVWSVIVQTFQSFPEWMQSIVFFFGTAGFAVPAFITLILALYYFYAVSTANKRMVQVLKNQLVLEGHDKQFLLHRLSTFIKQQQEHHKAIPALQGSNQNSQQTSNDISST